ncbi:MAG: TetR/AcrR family transcriptional regulator [Flavobacteriales bacterium]|jgi:TetR/AcrR family transcriptional repressor of multidrug resistance operon
MKKQVSRRDKILQTALRMISEGGFHNSPMSELASRSGVAVGTIYHHFESKDALIRALYAACAEQVSAAVLQGVDEKLSNSKRFETMWLNLHSWYSRHALEFSFIRQFESSPFVSGKGHDPGFFSQPVLDVFREGVKVGKLRKLKAGALSALFAGMVSSTVTMELREGKKLSGKELAELASMGYAAIRR